MADPVLISGPTNDSGGWNGSHTITQAGTSLVFWGGGSDDGTPVVSSIVSSLDGAPDIQEFLNAGTRLSLLAVWHNATVGTHTISVVETNVGEEQSSLSEWANLDSAQAVVEGSNTSTGALTTSGTTGLVSMAGEGLIFSQHAYTEGASTTYTNGDVTILDASRELYGYRIVSSSGSYNADITYGATQTAVEGSIVALFATRTGGGGETDAPIYASAPIQVAPVTDSDCSVQATITDASPITRYGAVVLAGAGAPSSSDIQNGTGTVQANANTTPSSGAPDTLTISGLTASTAYDYYEFVLDSASNFTAVQGPLRIVTPAVGGSSGITVIERLRVEFTGRAP